MFQSLFLLFGWLPQPLDLIFFGAFCVFLVVVLGKLIAFIIDMIPFL